MALDQDCTDALARISAYQASLNSLGVPIEPRLIAWGLAVLEKRGGHRPNLKRDWGKLTPEQRWRRVRACLPGTALNHLAGVLAAEYGDPSVQLSLVLSDGETTTAATNTAHNL